MNNQNKDKKRKFNAFIENSKHFSFISDFDLKHNKNNSNENYNNYISDQNHNLSFTQNINLLNNDQRIYKRYFPNTESKRDFIDNNDEFSSCSKGLIGNMLDFIVQNKNCFNC